MVQDVVDVNHQMTLKDEQTLYAEESWENMETLNQTFMEVYAKHLRSTLMSTITKHCFGCTLEAPGQLDHECLTTTFARSLDLYYDYSTTTMNRDAMLFDFLCRVEGDCIPLLPSFKMKNALESCTNDGLWRNKIKRLLLKQYEDIYM